jgi:DNA repair exonuclease SbcCD ATPase subunit
MKFDRLRAQNFLTLSTATIGLNDRGLNVIQGLNDDDSSASSNGAGKSSLVDALCWALFGTTARGVKGDAVVNRNAKKDCQVVVWMTHGETEYIVARHRKHKEHKNALLLQCRPAGDPGRVPDDLSKGTDAETQKEVERILGCSQEVFLAAVYSGQEIMPDLPKMTDRELKRLIEEAAGLERIELAYEEARARKNGVLAKLDAVSINRESVKTRMARDEANLEIKQREAEHFEEQRAERVKAAVANREACKSAAAAAALKLRDGKDANDKAILRLDELAVSLSKHAALDKAARDAELAASRAEGAIGRALLVESRQTVATIESQIANADAEMAKPCPECGKPHTEDEKAEYIAHRTKRLDDAKENLKLVEARVRKEIAEVQRLKEVAAAARAAVPDVSAVNEERRALTEVVRAFDKLMGDARLLRQNLEAAISTVAMRESEPNPAQAVVENLRESIASEASRLADLSTQHDKLTKELEVAEAVVKVFGPAGVRAHILDTVTPFLNERTADYLSALSDGAITAVWSTLAKSASGDLKEKFTIDVCNDKGGDSFLALSGGEKRKVRLATALALQDLVASRATQPIDLFIGDEIDDALDPAGLERLMVILERRARERGTVLVISHNDLADWCDQITTVRKSGGSSQVEGSLCV